MIIEVLIKILTGFLLIIVAFHFMGTKEIAQATPLDFAYTVLTTAIVGDMSLDPTYKIYHIVIVLMALWILVYGINYLTRKSKQLNKVIKGEPLIIVKNGNVVESTLRAERMTRYELDIKLRLKGVFNVKEVKIAYLEPNGEISVLKI